MKTFLIALLMLQLSCVAHADPVDCNALKSSYEPFQITRMIHTDGATDADHTTSSVIYRDPSGRMVGIRADSSGTMKTTNYNMLIVQVEHSAIKGANVKFEYTGVDPQTFSPDRSATYTRTSVAASGAAGVLKVEYTFVGRKTVAVESCQFDVIQYTDRSTSPDGREESFVEGEYSPELKVSLNTKTWIKRGEKQVSIVSTVQKLLLGTDNFAVPGTASSQTAPAPAVMPKMAAAQSASSPEFSVGLLWKYIAKPITPGLLFAHGQADIVNTTGAQLGGIGFYCAAPHSYIDIFVHRPGGGLSDYYWGDVTFKTSLELNGIKMPATVEHGIIYVDIGDDVRPVLLKALEFKSGAPVRRISIDVANLGKFELLANSAAPPRAAAAGEEVLSFERMMATCDATIAAQPPSK